MSYNTKNYLENGDKLVIGGTLEVLDGAKLSGFPVAENQAPSVATTIADLKADNDEAYKRINTAVDLDAVRETAINDLGMFYATGDQIVYYSVDKSDYMNQYNEIPEK